MIDPWKWAEDELLKQGFDLDRIPKYEHERHIWSDGILFFYTSKKRLPTAEELAFDMFDEWDDPVSVEEADHILKLGAGKG